MKTNKTNVSFKSGGLNIAGHLYTPDSYQPGDRLPAIVVGTPMGGIKKQTAGLYAKKMCERGFITLAFDY